NLPFCFQTFFNSDGHGLNQTPHRYGKNYFYQKLKPETVEMAVAMLFGSVSIRDSGRNWGSSIRNPPITATWFIRSCPNTPRRQWGHVQDHQPKSAQGAGDTRRNRSFQYTNRLFNRAFTHHGPGS